MIVSIDEIHKKLDFIMSKMGIESEYKELEARKKAAEEIEKHK